MYIWVGCGQIIHYFECLVHKFVQTDCPVVPTTIHNPSDRTVCNHTRLHTEVSQSSILESLPYGRQQCAAAIQTSRLGLCLGWKGQ